jgi:uncharacterized membrane protein YhhN
MKNVVQKWGISVYILLLSTHLYSQILGDRFIIIQFITKALLLPTLILYIFCQNFFKTASIEKWFVISAMIGSVLGDILLSFDKLFIIGMLAFMTTHIFNIIMFNKINSIGKPKSKKFLIYTFLLLAFCVFIYFRLNAAMGPLIYPILVYMALICSAALMAIHAGFDEKTKLISKLFWLPGMLFFIASDAVLAFNKFSWSVHHPVKNIGLITMLTYGLAQLMLAKGYQIYFNLKLNKIEVEN